MTNLVEWFDPYNKDHVAAYKHEQDTGMWPYRFLPMDIEIPLGWNVLIANKLADAWVDHILNGGHWE